jgi:hypothetical protein
MPTLIFGLTLVFWAAMALTAVFFIDLATCWWATRLRICPLRRWRSKLVKYHKYTRIALIALVIVHFALHLATDVYGIPV